MLKTIEAKHITQALLTGGENPMEIDGKIESVRLGVAGAGILLWGLTLNEWVAVATLLYLALQVLILLPKAYAVTRSAWRSFQAWRRA